MSDDLRLSEITEARNECERLIDFAVRAFLKRTGIHERAVEIRWDEWSVSTDISPTPRPAGYGAALKVVLT